MVKEDNNKKKTEMFNKKKAIFGFLIYFFVFVLIIPYTLYRLGYYTILEAYLPNVDLIANVLTWHGGPYELWKNLYLPTPLTIYGFTSQVLINYMALLGLTFLVSRETKRTGSIKKEWSLTFIMLIMTYLIPIPLVSCVMNKLYIYFKNNLLISHDILYTLTTLCGTLLTILIIVTEGYILSKYRNKLEYIANFLLSIFPKFMKK